MGRLQRHLGAEIKTVADAEGPSLVYGTTLLTLRFPRG